MGSDMIEQQRYLSRYGDLEKAQCHARQVAAVAGTQQATGEPISIEFWVQVINWMWDLAVQCELHPAVAHAAISLLNRALCFTLPKRKVGLLGACCLLIESYRAPGPIQRISFSQVQESTGT